VKELILAAIVSLGLVLQSSLLPFLEVRGVKPDLLLVMLVSMGFCGGNPLGIAVGLITGLLVDVLYGQALGLHALQYMLIGFGAGLFYNKVTYAKLLYPMMLTVGACLIKNILLYLYLFFSQTDVGAGAFFGQVVFPEMGYSLVLAYPVYFLMKWLFGKKVMDRRVRGNWFDF
jgi:rod shape-determining protein MreD